MLNTSALAYADNQVRFSHWFTADGEHRQDNIGIVSAIAQDAHGFIWLGGEKGVGRFDGTQLKIYRKEPGNANSLPRNFVRDITFDSNGVLWVATTAGLAYYEPSIDGFIPFKLNKKLLEEQLSTDVSSVAVDKLNNLVVGTHIGMAIIDPQRQSLRVYRNDVNDSQSISNDYIRAVLVDSKNYIWVGTSGGGLNRLDLERRHFTRYMHSEINPNSIIDNDIRAIMEDDKGRIWAGSYGAGISRLNVDGSFTSYSHDPKDSNSLGANSVHDILQDSEHRIWLATDHGGLARYREATNDFEHFRSSDFSDVSINSNHVRCLFEDRNGDLWVGAFPSGVNFFDRSTAVFQNFVHQPDNPHSVSDNAILKFFKDSEGILWVGTENGLNIFDKDSRTFTRIPHDANNPDALRFGTVLDIVEDIDGSLWFATWSGGLHHYNKKTKKFKNYFVDDEDPGSIGSKFIWRLLIDAYGDLWVGTQNGGLNKYLRETDSFKKYKSHASKPESLVNDHVWSLLEDKRGNFWVGTVDGLDILDRETGRFRHFRADPINPDAIHGRRIIALLEDPQGRIWIASQDEGLSIYLPDEQRFLNFGIAQGLPSNEVSSLVQDGQGSVWVGTGKGIVRVNMDTFAMKTFTKEHGLVGNHFNRDASFKDENGNIYVGSTDGISVFHPSQLPSHFESSPIYLTQLSILNEPVKVGVEGSPLQVPLHSTQRITLNHDDSAFSLDFALLSYRAPEGNRYRYRLQGFDEQWTEIQGTGHATYTNLDAGNYVFQVNGANRDGIWTPQPAQLQVVILPPLWSTWWAYIIYVLLLSPFVYYFWRSQIRRIEHSKEKRLNHQLQKVDSLKNAILANTSHELRTPLYSIIGLSESLYDGVAGDLNEGAKDYLKTVIGNGRKLTSMVDSILEYANLTRSLDTLHCRPVDLCLAVTAAMDKVQSHCSGKVIRLVNEVPNNASLAHADEARVVQILIDLLTHGINQMDDGTITVSILEKKRYLFLSVCDTGFGMTPLQVATAFEPFNYAEDNAELAPDGIHLSLAICKHLVEMQGGSIRISSTPGQGTCVSFSLPKEETYHPGIVKPPKLSGTITVSTDICDFDYSESKNTLSDLIALIGKGDNYTILVVDDDAVNRMVLISALSHCGFKTVEAASGNEALSLLSNSDAIHLVILDVMMPGLSGFETCKKIRESHNYFELPIIFLTAKKIQQATIDAYYYGGNEFVIKPVSKEDLLPRVINQLHCANLAKGSTPFKP